MSDTQHRSQNEKPFFTRQRIGSILLLVLLIVSLYGVFRIVNPYLHGIILGILFASLSRPIYLFLFEKTRKRQNLAATLTCALVALLVLGPILGFTSVLVVKGQESVRSAIAWTKSGLLSEKIRKFKNVIQEKLPADQETLDRLERERELRLRKRKTSATGRDQPDGSDGAEDRDGTETDAADDEASAPDDAESEEPAERSAKPWKQRLGNWVAGMIYNINGDVILSSILELSTKALKRLDKGQAMTGTLSLVQKGFGLIINFLVMLFVMFYALRDGAKISQYLLELSPLGRENERLLVDRVKTVTKSAVLGTALTGLVQSILSMIAFAICGIPQVLFWGVLVGFASLIPVVGTALIWVPCCIYLAIMGKFGFAIFLAIWCIVVVGMSDNFLRPMLMRGNTGMSPLIAFFAILGGIQLFGLIGVIYGPLIVGLAAILLYIYKLETGKKSKHKKSRRRRSRGRSRSNRGRPPREGSAPA